MPAGLHVQLADQLRRGHLALVPVLLRDEDRRGVVAEAAADEIEAGERDDVLVVRVRADCLGDFGHDLVGALERRAVGEDHRADVEALVLVRNQAARRGAPQPCGQRDHAEEQDRADHAAAQHPDDAVVVPCGDAPEPVVEPREEAVRRLVRLQDDGTQRRRERQRDEAGDDDRDRDRHGELPVELAGQAAEERDRDEYRGQRQHDRDDRPGHLAHRLDRRIARRQAVLAHVALDVFQHDDRIVDDDADREHHREQRQRVDRVAERIDAREGADQRHRHRGERNDRRAPALQEQVDDEKHEQHRLAERLQHFADRHFDEARRVVRNRVRQVLRESASRARRLRRLHALRDVERIGAGRQEDADERRVLAVEPADELVVLRSELDARDVAQAHRRAVGIRADDDLLEFLRLGSGRAS